MTIVAYRYREDGRYPVTVDEIRASANALFGPVPPKSVLDDLGLDAVNSVSQPAYDLALQTIREGDPEKLSDGTWAQTWVTSALPPAPVEFIPLFMLRQRVEKLGMLDIFAAYLAENPTLDTKLFSLEGGMVDPTYSEILNAFDRLQLPASARAYILAPPSAGVPDV